MASEIVKVEQGAEQPAGARSDHDRAWRGQSLKPRRKIGRIADHRLFLRGAFADQVTDHDQAGTDSHPDRQRCSVASGNHGGGTGQIQSRSHRPLRVVLMRLRPPKIGEDAVSHELGDVAVPVLDGIRANGLVGADRPPHVLGVEARGQFGRTDQIAKHHGDLAPLGVRPPSVARVRRARGPRRRGGAAPLALLPSAVPRSRQAFCGGARRTRYRSRSGHPHSARARPRRRCRSRGTHPHIAPARSFEAMRRYPWRPPSTNQRPVGKLQMGPPRIAMPFADTWINGQGARAEFTRIASNSGLKGAPQVVPEQSKRYPGVW